MEQLVLRPSADTYVDKRSANTNFGSATYLLARYYEEVYGLMKFNLDVFGGRPVKIHSATISKLDVSPGTAVTFKILEVTSAWTEYGTTYANRPTLGDEIFRERVSGSKKYNELDITQTVSDWVRGSKENHGISFHVENPVDTYIYATKEFVSPIAITELTIKYEYLNNPPTLALSSTNERTLYESDTYGISGTAQDTNAGDVVMVKYKINNGTARTIASPVSTGAEFPFNRSLIFKEGKLFDGATAVTTALAEGTQHVLTVWAEDDKGGKSAEQTRTFYVVPNRPPKLTVDPITPKTDMIDSDSFEIKGTVNNPDANGVKVHYKIGNSAFNEVYTSDGAGGEYSFRVTLSQLTVGANSLTVRATDHFGAVDTKTITITKAGNVIPLKTAVTRYKLTPPNGTAKGVLLWIERETGDLVVDAEISMTAAGEPENFQPMTKSATAFVSEGIEEDEFTFDAVTDKSNIILKITQTRTSTASEKGITLITGVFA